MRTLRNPYIWFVIASLLFCFFLSQSLGQDDKGPWAAVQIGMSQSPPPADGSGVGALNVAPANATVQVEQGITGTIVQLAQQYPVVASILILLGSLRLVIKPLMAGVRVWTTSTASKRDDEILDRVERSWLYTAGLFLLDWLTSIKVAPSTARPSGGASVPASRLPLFALLCSISLLLVACETTTPTGQIAVGVGPDGNVTNVGGGLNWDATTNINVQVGGSLDPATGEWSGNLLITFKQQPDTELMQMAAKAGAVAREFPSSEGAGVGKSAATQLVLRYDSSNRDHRLFIRAAQERGALISGLK